MEQRGKIKTFKLQMYRCYDIFQLNFFSSSLTIIFAIAREDVAAGDGAFLTCKIFPSNSSLPISNTKSSMSLPSALRA